MKDAEGFVKGVVQDAVHDCRDQGLTITDAAEQAQKLLDPHIYSNTSTADGPLEWVEPHDGEPAYQRRAWRRLTWRELYERELETSARYLPAHTILADLDRCVHGRHMQDECYGCPRGNEGNAYGGTRFGTTLYAEALHVTAEGTITATKDNGESRVVWEH